MPQPQAQGQTSAQTSPADPLTWQQLTDRFAKLQQAGASGFDPARMGALQALLQRAERCQGQLQAELYQRIQTRLQRLHEDFSRAAGKARATARRLREQYPQRTDQLVAQYQRGDFGGIEHMAHRLHQPVVASPLQQLIEQLANHDPAMVAADPDTFDTVLRKQELEAQQGDGLASLHSHMPSRLDKDALRSARRFRDHWARQAIDRAIARALQEAPENAGPLNSHLLVIRTLNTLGEIAPDYLNRFVSYVDTLLWLEHAAAEKVQKPGARG